MVDDIDHEEDGQSTRRHLLSPVRPETPSHSYNLRSTPDRIVAGGDVAGPSSVGGGIAGSRVSAGGVAVGGQHRERGGRGARIGRGVAGRGSSGDRRSRQPTGATAGGLARGGVKNYTPAEVESLLETIRAVCPIGNNSWELVAELHSNRYGVCGRTAESIKRKFSSLASTQPSSGNPTMPHPVAMAKEIREAIDHRAGLTDLNQSDVFEEGEEDDDDYEEDYEEGVHLHNNPPPQEITVSTNQEAAVVTQLEQPETLNNQQQLDTTAVNHQQQFTTTASSHDRRASVASSSHLSTVASGSVAQSKARTRQNVISSAIENATTANNSAFAAFLQQKQIAEDFELRQRQIEREEARARREEELFELRRKEIRQEEQRKEELFELRRKEIRQEEQRNRLEEERNMMFQLAMTGIMGYFGIKPKEKDDDNK
jgi:hypothetical protein